MLRLFVFGTPRIEHDGQVVPLRRSKALALLAYLALTRQAQDRTALLTLLWPEFDDASARNNLRRELSLLKAALDAEILIVDRLQVAWDPQVDVWVDVLAFQARIAVYRDHRHEPGEACSACVEALTSAVGLYVDEFAAGFSLPDSPSFDEWQFFQREGLRQQLAEALQALIHWHSARQAHGTAFELARRWLALDPLHEPAQRELMRQYAWSGQPSAALRQYEELTRLLEKELGVTPEDETIELYRRIRSRAFARQGDKQTSRQAEAHQDVALAQSPGLPVSVSAGRQLPSNTGFVGRRRELADLLRRLTDPDCRLLTIVGPGGIGKTSLALQAARVLAEEWSGDDALADGVLFVPLAAVDSSSGLLAALAGAAQFEFYPDVAPHQQLLDYFREKRMLIVLDNFEQLLHTAQAIAELLAAAPHLRLLVTSRAALSLHDEWFHPIEGLSFPAAPDEILGVSQLARFDAVRLFEQHARRIRSEFSLGNAAVHVVKLCRLVEGMPLAIELAASWLKVLTVEQVVDALERGLDILSARDRTTPERHRNMRTVLEQSWHLLTEAEQQALAGLSAFYGRFSATAARAVAGATLDLLATLVEQSLLRHGADGRFQLHELVRQFAREKLALAPEHESAVRQQHSRYYLALLKGWNSALEADRASSALETSDDAENIQAAWSWAGARQEIAAIEQALEPLADFYQSRGLYQHGLASFASAAAYLATTNGLAAQIEHQQIRTRLLGRQGLFCYLLGDYNAASSYLERCLPAAQALALAHEEALALSLLGQIAAWRGDYELAKQHLRQSLAISRAQNDNSGSATTLERLAEILCDLGDLEGAKQLGLESLALSRELQHPDRIGHALDRLGYVAFCFGRYQEAAAYYQEALALFGSIDHQLGGALELGGHGLVAWAGSAARLHEAQAYYEQSLALFRRLGHQRHIAERLIDLSELASDNGEYPQAWRYAEEALTIARGQGSLIHISGSLSALGRSMGELGDFQAGKSYITEALALASAAHLSIGDIKALFHSATLLVKERALASRDTQAKQRRSLRIIEALEIVIRHPASWHYYRVRGQRLSDELRRGLPADLIAAA
ncbi:MAG TPA: tetratricopeptide repeat protein, partial [Roseiflexaceae bacterium]|nr:tetratricopeptide repeat protein [Roseiflexaceae bacterium]